MDALVQRDDVFALQRLDDHFPHHLFLDVQVVREDRFGRVEFDPTAATGPLDKLPVTFLRFHRQSALALFLDARLDAHTSPP